MSENAWFSADYRQARGRFLDAAADVGARVETHENPVPGPNGGPLATDVAFLGDPQAEAALLAVDAEPEMVRDAAREVLARDASARSRGQRGGDDC